MVYGIKNTESLEAHGGRTNGDYYYQEENMLFLFQVIHSSIEMGTMSFSYHFKKIHPLEIGIKCCYLLYRLLI